MFSIVMVWALYPEANQRTLEEMNLVFACESVWNWEAERNFQILREQILEPVQAAKKGDVLVDQKTGMPKMDGDDAAQRPSLITQKQD